MTKELLGSLELNHIYAMDCVEGMKMLPDECIDLTVTSPPYDNLRTYKGYSFDFEAVANELHRITKPGGVVVWVVGDATINGSETLTSFRQALYFKKIGFNVHDTMIYQKENPLPRQRNRYEQAFEYMFVFSKGKPKTTNLIKVPCKQAGNIRLGSARDNNQDALIRNKPRTVASEKIKPNVWVINSSGYATTKDKIAFKHPAIFPEALARDHILSWSNPGDIILDPFMGSGTTAKMALLNNRKFIGFEISPEYVEIANKRLENARNELKSV
jgi:DNA modification methylase